MQAWLIEAARLYERGRVKRWELLRVLDAARINHCFWQQIEEQWREDGRFAREGEG